MPLVNNYDTLTPDTVIAAVESLGYAADARILGLNSYENRVYQVGIEDDDPIIVKFYRPNRWSDTQIREEHDFSQALADLDIPVLPPLRKQPVPTAAPSSLFRFAGFRFALYTRKGGHAPELENGDHLEVIGRFIGRIHALGKTQLFAHRPTIDIQSYGIDSKVFLLEENFIPNDLQPAYESLSNDLIERITTLFKQLPYQAIRLHGDCHPSNILWRDGQSHFVDFDDARNGPAIQDLWMLLSGDYNERCLQLADILSGYSEFCDFDPAELGLIEGLRTLRLMHYSAWLAKRWSDPAFPHNFPWFNTERYWAEHILALREQLAALQEPPLRWL